MDPRTWFIADTHFGHKNIVKGISQWTDLSGCRDFLTQEEHDNHIIDVINRYVKEDDVLWHLGDWSFGGKQNVELYMKRINCETVHLVVGNHDHHARERSDLFASIQHYKELVVDGEEYVLSHYPLESWNNMERGSFHWHGHVHGKGRKMKGRYDAGIEAHGLVPESAVRFYYRAVDQRHKTVNGGNRFGT